MAWRYPRELKPEERERGLFKELKEEFLEATARLGGKDEEWNLDAAAYEARRAGDVHILVRAMKEKENFRALRKLKEFNNMLAKSELKKELKKFEERAAGWRVKLAIQKIKNELSGEIEKVKRENSQLAKELVFFDKNKRALITPPVVEYLTRIGLIRRRFLEKIRNAK